MTDNRGKISVASPFVIEWMVDYVTLSEGKDEYFKSQEFQYLDGIWYLQCYPYSNSWPGYTSLYLMNKKIATSQDSIRYQLGIRCRDGTVYDTITPNVYSSKKPQLLSRTTLTKDKWIIAPRGMVNYFCILRSKAITVAESQTTSFEGTSVSTQTLDDLTTEDIQDHEEKLLSIPTGAMHAKLTGTDKLAQDLKDLMLNEKDCDITIKINERDIRAHRLILGARSPVFLAMFSHDTIERKTGIVTIEDCDPDIFHTFLIFLYTGEVQEFTPDNVCNLYVVSEKYDVQELKLKCIKYMVKYVSIDNFCDIMRLALKYKENPLIKAATDFFVKNAKKIIITVQWQCFIKEYPLECNELNIKLLAHVIPE